MRTRTARLAEHRARRDLQQTREPAGAGRSGPRRPRFVVQLHDARTLHYDFRLEVDGVLKSWVLPKGPSTDPRARRLAIPTEDHPLEYADFEGVIPEGRYGAATVIVWDRGWYRNLTVQEGREVPMAEALARGRVKVWLEGQKLRGGYALLRLDRGGGERWLLVKMRDQYADTGRDPVTTRPESVKSGRTLAEVAKAA